MVAVLLHLCKKTLYIMTGLSGLEMQAYHTGLAVEVAVDVPCEAAFFEQFQRLLSQRFVDF